jgi:hypothetical protein
MLFPPAAAVAVSIDGRPVLAYHAAYLWGGHVYAPLRPYVTGLAYQAWYEGDTLIIARGDRQVRIRLQPQQPGALDSVYVPLAHVLRALGVAVTYQPHHLEVRARYAPLTSPTPFNPTLPSVAPTTVFTPLPSPTPRPVWTGSPLPRRTPLPITEPTPAELVRLLRSRTSHEEVDHREHDRRPHQNRRRLR